jgi:DNA-binding FrmR family transcriptional regulator
MSHEHRGYQDVDHRLARMEGHMAGVRRMWQEGRPCHEVLLQLAALRGAVNRTARVIMREHVESCIGRAVERGSGEEAVEDLLRALERLL